MDADELEETYLTANVWLAGTGDEVSVSINGGEAASAQRTQTFPGDTPNIGAEFTDAAAAYEQLVHGGGLHDRASHLWRLPLPTDLAPGEHSAVVTVTDR